MYYASPKGKKSPKSSKSPVRKHSAVRQSGPRKGTLKKGFKYDPNGSKTANGLPVILKVAAKCK